MELPIEHPAERLQEDWTATRTEGLRRIDRFAPLMGRHYQARRNHDLGPADRSNVSVLSPWITRRVVTEEEVLRAALARHSLPAAEKFVQEVVWRGYWKGWLEMRPAVWAAYRAGLSADRRAVAGEPALAKAIARAEAGRTGIDAFDAWAAELTETGYLHNHARMWFASIWIFTLGLPWRLGADFFLRHLLDGDAASNTLSWRWVAGLHTRGKTYAAAAWNIRKFTGGRFAPEGLAAEAEPLAWDEPPGPGSIREPLGSTDRSDGPIGLLLTAEDLGVETMAVDWSRVTAVATLDLSALRSDRDRGAALARFDAAALADAGARAAALAPNAQIAALEGTAPGVVADWAQAAGLSRIVTGYAHVGWTRDWFEAASRADDGLGIRPIELRRPWDDAVEPHATAGFFKVKKTIPEILCARGLRA